ncbi:MAG: hypothetical protein AB1Z98_29025 [Nannocystaceae bacterium]
MGGKRTKNNVYVVDVGGSIREFDNWPACQAFVNGTPHAFAGGVDRAQAMAKLQRSRGAQQRHHSRRADGSGDSRPAARASTAKGPRPTAGICADAGTHGNPGPSEYQVCDLAGTVLEHRHLGVHSNNYAELAGIAAMVEHALEHGHRLLWTDSKIAMGWIASGRVGATVHERELVVAMARRIGQRLSAHPELELCKWHTKAWGEIPADFGRK